MGCAVNIAYFSNQFASSNGHGIKRYARQLYAAMNEIRPDLNLMPVATWTNYGKKQKKCLEKQYGLRVLPWGRRLTPILWAFLDWPPVERWISDSVDLVHALSLGYPLATRKPYVVTVHDLGPLTHPEFFTNTHPWVMATSLKQAVSKADALICVSQATADELESYTGGRLGSRIRVVHEGVSPEFFEPVDPLCLLGVRDLPESDIPFILMSGAISPRKNISRLIRAFSRLTDVIPHHLVLTGGKGWQMKAVIKEMQQPGVEGRIHQPGYLRDDQLRALYARASLYIYPSLYEGFWSAVAGSHGVRMPGVVTSNISSLPEVVGDTAILVDPHSEDDIAAAMVAVCTDSSLARNLAVWGRARGRGGFTWVDCAREVAGVYDAVI